MSLNSAPLSREQVLNGAKNCVCNDRNNIHGAPEDSFSTIAVYWTNYLRSRGIIPDGSGGLTGVDVAAMMILLKTARLASSPHKEDHWIDLAGYAACGGEIATHQLPLGMGGPTPK